MIAGAIAAGGAGMAVAGKTYLAKFKKKIKGGKGSDDAVAVEEQVSEDA